MILFLRLWVVSVPVFAMGCSPAMSKLDISRLITSGRDGFQYPERVIETLALSAGDRVAEIGAGDGYWLPWLSEAVGDTGVVYAVEVEDDEITALNERVARDALANVVVIRGDYDDPKLPEGQVDLAMTCLTYHHIDNREVYFENLLRVVAPGGRVAHLDDRPGLGAPIEWFQSKGHWSEPDAIVREMEAAGYRRTGAWDFLPVQSFQMFEPGRRPIESVGAGAAEAR